MVRVLTTIILRVNVVETGTLSILLSPVGVLYSLS